ncbi:MAG TPA: TolC family protein [Nevskiaceae bacterium]|nr:TolC family protein [Nevskiaceae bacterium]
MRRLALLCAVAVLLGGCATYRPLALNPRAQASRSVADIKVAPSDLQLLPQRHHRFDPSRGLDMTDVAILAVANNPQLKLARAGRSVASAQAFAAGLLPDPVLDLAHGVPAAGPSDTSSFDLGLAYDVAAVLAHPLVQRAAADSVREVDLDLLWMAWQVAGKAQQLFIHDVYQAKTLAVLRQETQVLAREQARLAALGRGGDVALVTVAASGDALAAVQDRLHAAERQQLKTRQALDALLGLSPEASLRLVGSAKLPEPSAAAVAEALAALPHRRPDLLALQAGYHSADARYRAAILAQFPALQVGFSKGRDTDGIYSRSFQISLTLPIFNRNRGAVAMTKATRKRLQVEYAVRLAQARSQVQRIRQRAALLARQRVRLQRAATAASKVLDALQDDTLPGDVANGVRARLRVDRLKRRLALLATDESLFEQRAALQTLLGATRRPSTTACATCRNPPCGARPAGAGRCVRALPQGDRPNRSTR